MRSLGWIVTSGYGLTECTPVVAASDPDPSKVPPGTSGRILPRTEVRVVLEDGSDAAPEGEGELWVAGPQVMSGYWNKPEATAEVLVTDKNGKRWFRTGDLAVMHKGQHLIITGRTKDL